MIRKLSALVYKHETGEMLRVSEVRRFGLYFFAALLPLVLLHAFELSRDLATDLRSDSIFSIRYSFGTMLESMYRTGKYRTFHDGQLWTVAARLPMIPLFLSSMARFSTHLLPVVLAKNAVFWCLWAYAMLRLARERDSPVLLVILSFLLSLTIPLDLYVAFNIEYEEAYLFQLLALLFVLAVARKTRLDSLLFGSTIFLVYLTKSSMLPLCAFLAIAALVEPILPGRKKGLHWAPLLFLLAAIAAWGTFTLRSSGQFAFGSTSSSWNGWNLYKGNNGLVKFMYPRLDLDILDRLGYLRPEIVARDEWDLNRYYFLKASDFVSNHRLETIVNDLKKTYVIFLAVGGSFPGEGESGRFILASMIVNRILLWSTIFFCLRLLGEKGERRFVGLVTLGMIGAYVAPYIVGFAYFRHMVPVFGVCILFLLWYASGQQRNPASAVEPQAVDCID